MKPSAVLLSLFVLCVPTFAALSEPWTEDDFIEVSGPASPHVAYALRQNANGLSILVDVASIDAAVAGRVEIGLQAAKKVILDPRNARITRDTGVTRFAFTIPSRMLITQPSDWEKLRMALSVAWPSGPFGTDRQRERFLHVDEGAAFDPLSPDPQNWQPLDLKEHAIAVANRKKRIFVDIDQPLDGKATIVIEDGQGHRIRNLISGQPLPMGRHRIEWDGLDEQGSIIAAGAYRWRALSHPGITPHYLFSFYNHGNPPWRNGTPTSNWLADHSNAIAAATYGDRVYLGAPIAESGDNIVQLDLAGRKTGSVTFPALVGVGKLFLAADADCFYAIMEGSPPYEPFHDLPDARWQYRRPLNVMRWTTDGKPKPYDGARGEKVLAENLMTGSGPHPAGHLPDPDNLAGAALLDGKLYVSLKQENRIVIMTVADGRIAGEIKVPNPGLMATDGKGVLTAFSGASLVRIEPATLKTTPLFAPKLSELPKDGDPEDPAYGFAGANPTGMAIDGDGEVFLSDNGVDQNVKVFDLRGKLLRQVGKRGGRPLNGSWDSTGVYQPHGIAVDREAKLWATETDNAPRRNSIWNAKTGALIFDLMGPCFYGANMGSFDTADHTRWIGGGALWKLDFDKQTAIPISTLYHQTKAGQMESHLMGRYWNFYHRDGRTFLLGYGQGQSIYELRPDGSTKLWAFCGSLGAIAQEPRWTVPKAITDVPAVKELFARNAVKNHNPPLALTLTPFGPWRDKVKLDFGLIRDIGILWVDRNGDDLGEPDEFEVLPWGDSLQDRDWGTGNPTLDLKVAAIIGGNPVLLNLKPDGFLPSGAPNYSLAKAVASAAKIDPGIIGADSIQDRFGREIFNSTPMKAVAADGHVLWTFPNQWVGVAGSHESPLPERGVMQGALYFLGTAPLDADSEVFIMNGNHGRFFVLTTDGFYLDEMFKDVRVTQNANAYLIGGECFGGCFGRAENGRYYLQSGHTDYRIFQIDGLDQIKRSQGTLQISAAQTLAAQGNSESRAAKVLSEKVILVEEAAAGTRLPDDPNRWPGSWSAHWGNPVQPFPYAEVKAVRSGDRIYLAYRVKDPSPWVNHGTDWTMLFKTGDSVDFQFSTDPKAKSDRNNPVPGDHRLLIAPFQERSIAVLYSYRELGATKPLSFSSPWRSEKVDRVTELKSARISVQPGEGTYTLAVSVPLSELGLPPAGQAAELRGDFGVIYGDTAGSMNLLRSYWSNQATGLVNDVPGEIMIAPRMWGTLKFTDTPTP